MLISSSQATVFWKTRKQASAITGVAALCWWTEQNSYAFVTTASRNAEAARACFHILQNAIAWKRSINRNSKIITTNLFFKFKVKSNKFSKRKQTARVSVWENCVFGVQKWGKCLKKNDQSKKTYVKRPIRPRNPPFDISNFHGKNEDILYTLSDRSCVVRIGI